MSIAPTGWSGGDPEAFTALTLVRASLAMRRVFIATLAPHDLTPQQFNVLLHLVQDPGRSQADLAREVMATPQSVGELLRSMEEEGMVERTPPAGRGLPSAVYATATGRALLDEVTPFVLAAFAPEALGLDPTAYARLNLDLHSILAALGT
ncbi:MarR family winged helix-turn-helix transcriptional regulator [Kineococcus sp. GCM10028916]|uniref:MarR family winged helix-turn-helix transcriptional regulator n=1 Tax=unclassified Kineococcus TaxID=2621656 RepID=UPI002E1F85CA